MNSLSAIIEDAKKLTYDELQELNYVTGKYLAEIERERIKQAHIESLREYKSGKLKFSSQSKELIEMMDDL